MTETTSSTEALLRLALSAAVPLWVEELRREPFSEIQRLAEECSRMLAEDGDNILFKSKKKGASADAFNALAKGIACLSFAPGGVTIFGLHFENKLERKF